MKLWIARDSYGLWLFSNKPIKTMCNGDKYFYRDKNTRYLIDSELFPEVTFENSPHQVEIKFVKEK